MAHTPKQKTVHLHFDQTAMTYQVQAEYDLAHAPTEEEDEQLKTLAHQQIEVALEPHRKEGWILDETHPQPILLERRITGKEGGFLRGHIHTAAIVGAKVQLRKNPE